LTVNIANANYSQQRGAIRSLCVDPVPRPGVRSARPSASSQEASMFIAMNRFRIANGQEEAFERIWLGRDSRLTELPGFIAFHLLKGPAGEGHTLYASHSMWASRADFDAWTTSEQFRSAHSGAGSTPGLYLGPPQFEGFEVRQTVAGAAAAA
jgi:heme-degrading monooxygenase HmoA